ncbi:acidic leucine-rich nuclear phosphoprotein 32 family member B-like [Paramacrobiotus metropolitanus]|uniref:acidic leucine-rich nuclear phosphoprotein 32 family member B-like n=1 Tax=Paramacrobiotus metropolitanus TaxID=2943436 RepID=UPI002445F103|nr:acidic leucine-rich nuclear phosphoprotein 32 family member B-like [Paramacrobiotus metropolitanus]
MDNNADHPAPAVNFQDATAQVEAYLQTLAPTTSTLYFDHFKMFEIPATPLLAQFTNIQSITAAKCGLTSLANLPGKATLQSLYLEGNALSGSALEALRDCHSLRQLHLADNLFESADDFRPIRNLPLELLDVGFNPITRSSSCQEALELLFPSTQIEVTGHLVQEDSSSDEESELYVSDTEFEEESTKILKKWQPPSRRWKKIRIGKWIM